MNTKLLSNKYFEMLPEELKTWTARSKNTKRYFMPESLLNELEALKQEMNLLNKSQVISVLISKYKGNNNE